MNRGYFGIGVYNPKTESNIGTLWRSAYSFGAHFIFTIGRRYQKQASDTTKTWRHIPLYNYQDWGDFKEHIPHDCLLVCIENVDGCNMLGDFTHPERCIYLLGAEDTGIPKDKIKGNPVLMIPSVLPHCLNVATAGSIVMYDRFNHFRRSR